MTLFLICLMPLTYLIINSLFAMDNVRLRDLFFPFVLGMLIYVPAVLFYWSYSKLPEPGTGFFSLLFYSLATEQCFFWLIAAGLVLLFIWPSRYLKITRIRELAGYICGFYFLRSLHIAAVRESWYGIDELFLTPAVFLSGVLFLSLFMARFLLDRSHFRYVWLTFVITAPLILSLPKLFILYNLPVISIVLTLLILAGSGFLFFLETRKRLPGYPFVR